MFKSDRIFYIANQLTGKTEWFFQARNGHNIGPYNSRQEAETILPQFIEECISTGSYGERKAKNQDSEPLTSISDTQTAVYFEPKDNIDDITDMDDNIIWY
ncbi:MAG: DUF6316 family protein [Methylococcaceae bacterium]